MFEDLIGALWEMMDVKFLSETCQLLYKHKDKNAFLSLVGIWGYCTDDMTGAERTANSEVNQVFCL